MTLSETVAEGIVTCSVGALRAAGTAGTPDPAGMRGPAHEYDALALADWNAGRR